MVNMYVEQLLQDTWRNRVQPSEICVITPYAKQKQKVWWALNVINTAHDAIKVGSTEEFQGQERWVIIISTVRSFDQFIEHDHKFKLGFGSWSTPSASTSPSPAHRRC